MSKRIYASILAAAVASTFAGQANAAFSVVNGAGASAVSNSLKNLLLGSYCTLGAAATSFYDNDTTNSAKGAVYRIQCTKNPAVTAFVNDPDISYDTSGGSWKGLTSFSPNLFAAAQQASPNPSTFPVATVNTVGCAAPVVKALTVEGVVYNVNYFGSCPAQNLAAAPQFGVTDVDAQLFNAPENQPLVDQTWNTASPTPLVTNFVQGTERTGFPVSIFGMTFGIAASPTLYAALYADQYAAGIIPAACPAPAAYVVETSGSTTLATGLGCAPHISRAQYRSIIENTVGSLNTNLRNLFTNVVPANLNVTVARRDRGSGTQATSNAYFLGAGCTNAATEAADLKASLPFDSFAPGYTVQYDFTTGNVLTALGTAATNTIGVISADNEGSMPAGGGFLRLDGVYPSNTNAANGIYDLWTEEQLHCQAGLAGDQDQLCKDLGGLGAAGVSAKNYVGPGTINLATAAAFPVAQVAAGNTKGGVASTWYFQDVLGKANFCGGRYSH